MKRFALLLIALAFSTAAFGQVRSCDAEQAAFNKANAAYEKANTPAKNFFRSFRNNGSSASLSLAAANLREAMGHLQECQSQQASDQRQLKDRARQQAEYETYAATPEGKRRIARAKELNRVVDGKLDMASFTPAAFMPAVEDNGWALLGENESTAYWYSFWIEKQKGGVGVVLKGANKGIGDDYTTVDFVSGSVDCLHSSKGTYPSFLNMGRETTLSAASGYPIPGSPGPVNLGNVPLSRGLVISEAVKMACDRVASN